MQGFLPVFQNSIIPLFLPIFRAPVKSATGEYDVFVETPLSGAVAHMPFSDTAGDVAGLLHHGRDRHLIFGINRNGIVYN